MRLQEGARYFLLNRFYDQSYVDVLFLSGIGAVPIVRKPLYPKT